MYSGHYVGYGTLEVLLEEAKRTHATLYADVVLVTVPATLGMEDEISLIQAAFFSGDVTHFWRWQAASSLKSSGGHELDPSREERAKSARESAWQHIKAYLEENAARLVRSTASMPKDMIHAGGSRPAFLQYDLETAVYSPRKKEDSHD